MGSREPSSCPGAVRLPPKFLTGGGMPPRRRIRKKSAPPSLGKAGVGKPKIRKKTKAERKRTARALAVEEGQVPRARTAYALFTSAMSSLPQFQVPWRERSKLIAAAWKGLGSDERKTYQDQSRSE